MRNLIFTLTTLLFLNTLIINAQNSLYIHDPNVWWAGESGGIIEEASFMIEPKGAYMEVGMILQVAPPQGFFSSWHQLEIMLHFSLPEGSIVHDSWLWMEDDTTIVKADILEYWEASTIYDDIVLVEQQDPSLLYEVGENEYLIRIYPLATDHFRKFKITYLVPAKWEETEVSALLPVELLNTSILPVETIDIYTVPDPFWTNPRISHETISNFVTYYDPGFGNILYAELANPDLSNEIKFLTDAPLNDDNLFLSAYEEGDDKFFQLIFFPDYPDDWIDGKKILFLFDHEDANTAFTSTQIFELTRQHILDDFEQGDMFNMLFSTPNGVMALSDNWLTVPDASAMTEFWANDHIQDYSSVMDLLSDGINFIQDNGGDGELLLLSSSDDISYTDWIPNLGQIAAEINGIAIPTNIIDYQSTNYITWSNGSNSGAAPSNYNFYDNLAAMTTGEFLSPANGHPFFSTNMESIVFTTQETDIVNNIFTDMENGFTYNVFNQTYLGQSVKPDEPIIQVGKFSGDYPFHIDFTSVSDGNIIFQSLEVDEGQHQIHFGDTLSREMWVGNYLNFLEDEVSSSADIADIIDISINERVLSDYTAFLALDLINGGEPCPICLEAGNGGGTVSVISPDERSVDFSISAYPNPFVDICKIEIDFGRRNDLTQLDLVITDVSGKILAHQEVYELVQQGRLNLTWDGTDSQGNQLAPGIYFLNFITNKGSQTIKLTLQ
ncbi:MAG: FlgD immunoglobulin-like domain containing protein [Bacteroidota bacterium]